MKNAPETIFLQVGEDCPDDADFKELHEVTWCGDKQHSNDIEYRRADLMSCIQQPVGHVFTMDALVPGESTKYHAKLYGPLPSGTKLYAGPVVEGATVAWVRKHPDGTLSRDWLWNDVIEEVRKTSGAWFPVVFGIRPAAKTAPVGQDVIDAVTRYGDARADGGDSAAAIGEVVRLMRVALSRTPATAGAEVEACENGGHLWAELLSIEQAASNVAGMLPSQQMAHAAEALTKKVSALRWRLHGAAQQQAKAGAAAAGQGESVND